MLFLKIPKKKLIQSIINACYTIIVTNSVIFVQENTNGPTKVSRNEPTLTVTAVW